MSYEVEANFLRPPRPPATRPPSGRVGLELLPPLPCGGTGLVSPVTLKHRRPPHCQRLCIQNTMPRKNEVQRSPFPPHLSRFGDSKKERALQLHEPDVPAAPLPLSPSPLLPVTRLFLSPVLAVHLSSSGIGHQVPRAQLPGRDLDWQKRRHNQRCECHTCARH